MIHVNGEKMRRNIGLLLIICMLLLLSSCFGGEHEHTPEKIEASAASCTESGNSEYYRCTECGKYFSDSECLSETTPEAHNVAPSGHVWVDASCVAPKTCSLCHSTVGDALGHEWSGDCDSSCNRQSCGATRVAQSHLDSDEDDVCDSCGESVSSDVPVGGGDGEFLPPDEFED